MTKVLFIVENDYFPRDARVYNEALSLSNNGYQVFVLAPQNNKKKEKFYELVENKFFCYRHPHYESSSIKGLLLEYLIAFLIYLFFVPFLVFTKRIKIIHVANPPDFILLSFCWLKLFKIKFIFDVHDLSVETFRSKTGNNNFTRIFIIRILSLFESISIRLSDIIIVTNNSIKEILKTKYHSKKIYIVRNSNRIRHKSISDISKGNNENLTLGYFGIISDDGASGYENLALLGKYLKDKGINYTFEIIGNGGGLLKLKKKVEEFGLIDNYIFRGFIELQKAFKFIEKFDFGILPWPNVPKNNLHTAMKLMDYMCCGVPVCTLKLKEQMVTTNGIGIHSNSFEEMVDEIIDVYNDKNRYEILRKDTLEHFNTNLCWEKQEIELLKCYRELGSF